MPTGPASISSAETEVYGSRTQLREFFETRGQAYVLRVVATFMVTLAKLGLAQCQAQLCTAIIRNIVLVMAAPARTPLALDRPVVRRFRPTT
jgi:Tfp pilus assembly pilus retraction ATPase PilT